MNKFIIFILLLGFSMLTNGCNNESPAWLAEMIKTFQSEPATNPPRKIYQYTYQQKNVFYIPPISGDIMSELYDQDGKKICSPDGGIIGRGDGQCPDFHDKKTEEKLIWQDNRK